MKLKLRSKYTGSNKYVFADIVKFQKSHYLPSNNSRRAAIASCSMLTIVLKKKFQEKRTCFEYPLKICIACVLRKNKDQAEKKMLTDFIGYIR